MHFVEMQFISNSYTVFSYEAMYTKIQLYMA